MVLFESVKQFTLHPKTADLGLNIGVVVHHITASKAVPAGIPVSGPPPAPIITSYSISATRLLRMCSMVDLR